MKIFYFKLVNTEEVVVDNTVNTYDDSIDKGKDLSKEKNDCVLIFDVDTDNNRISYYGIVNMNGKFLFL